MSTRRDSGKDRSKSRRLIKQEKVVWKSLILSPILKSFVNMEPC